MALVTVGNTRIGDSWFETHPYYGVNYEYCACYNFFHYKIVATERSHEKKIRIAFYSHRPTSNYYGLVWGIYPKDIIPAVFRAENGVPVEVLSTGNLTFPFKDNQDGWEYFEVYLKRDFEVGEEIWAGVWGEVLNPIWDSRSVSKGTCCVNMFYTFGTFGRKYDYAPYFDNGEILNSSQGADTVKGNYSLYWQYYNAPVPNDLNVKVGNPRMGNKWYWSYEVEREGEDGYYTEDVDMEWWTDAGYFGYRFQLPTATYQNKIKVHIFHRKPTHKDYYDNVEYYEPTVIPVVFKCDSNGKFTELMNVSVSIIEKELNFNGWIDAEVTLKRNFNAGEYVFAGFYVSSLNPVWLEISPSSGVTGNIVERYFEAYGENENLEFIRDGGIFNDNDYRDFEDGYYSLYFEYCDISPRTDYVRGVVSSGNVVAVAYKTARVKTVLQEIKNIRDSSERNLALFRLFSDVKRFESVNDRSSELKRNNSESFGLRDFVNRTIGLFARVFTKLDASDDVYRRLKIKRFESSVNFLSTRVNAGRLIFRTVATVFGLWDWLKGKIRNENCIVELFTPITDELILECKI